MFIGIQKVNDGFKEFESITAVKETREELESLGWHFVRIEEVDFLEQYLGVYYTSKEELETSKKSDVKNVRNQMLINIVDPYICNPYRMKDLPEEEQNNYLAYRQYLLDYTKTDKWWENVPLTLDEWKKEQ